MLHNPASQIHPPVPQAAVQCLTVKELPCFSVRRLHKVSAGRTIKLASTCKVPDFLKIAISISLFRYGV